MVKQNIIGVDNLGNQGNGLLFDIGQRAKIQNLDVVSQTYELGRATVFDVLAEQRRYLDFEHAYSNALREAYDARTALRRALGDVR